LIFNSIVVKDSLSAAPLAHAVPIAAFRNIAQDAPMQRAHRIGVLRTGLDSITAWSRENSFKSNPISLAMGGFPPSAHASNADLPT